ncbi:MAG: DUF4367 domain-containing protein [Eubacterium sp.]|nr:DUF4367 domain-containing protein [Eubacterium sp.]
MKDILKCESDAYREKEIEKLTGELEALISKAEMDYRDLKRIDEINGRLEELEPLPEEFSAEEEWGKFEKEFLSGKARTDETKRKKVKKFNRKKLWLLGAAAAVIMIANIFSTMLVGADLFSGFKILTDNTLEIRYKETEPQDTVSGDYESYSSVNELEEQLDIKFMLPGWLPKGYDVGYVIYSSGSGSVVIRYYLQGSDNEIVQIIRKLTDGKRIYMPKDDTPPYTVVHDNIEFNVYGNGSESFIEWTYNGYSYYLGGVLDEEQIRKIINNMK